MKITCISDLHGHYPKLEGGDLLIIAGDLTATDSDIDWSEYFDWLGRCSEKYKKIIVVAGNHDRFVEEERIHPASAWNNISCYLCDEGTEFSYQIEGLPEEDEGFLPSGKRTLKIWGSPWTKSFPGMNPKCKAFTVDTDEELAEKWALIPSDTDILITHCPPYSILDEFKDYFGGKILNVGSKSLYNKLWDLKLSLHCFGHIHEAYGYKILAGSKYVNASHVNERYEPVNKPIRIELDAKVV